MKRFNLSEWALGHRSLVLYAMIVLASGGVLSYTKLGQSEDPPFTFKVMVIRTGWPGATARQVEEQITDKIEKKLQETPNVDVIQQLLQAGESLVFFQRQGLGAAGGRARHLVPGAEEDRRHPQHPARRHHRARRSTTSSATSTATSTR